MPVLALIAASSMVAAQWPSPVVGQDDYPTTALLRDKSAATMLEILIDPEGKVVKCTESGVVGDKQLASEMCKIAKHKKATPARDMSGKPAFGFRRDFASLSLPGTYQGDQIGNVGPAPDVDIQVASVPAGSQVPVIVNLTIAVDKAGKTAGCEYSKGGANAAFAKVACNQVRQMDFDKLTDGSGAAIGYVRPVTVRFSLADKP
jgi:hypothetical protein